MTRRRTSTTGTLRKDLYFAQVPEWVLFHPDLSPQAVRLYAALVRYADNSGVGWPRRRVLAERLHVSPKTIDRAVGELVEAHAVSVDERYDDRGDQTSNSYTVHLAPPEGVASRVTNPLDTDDQGGLDTHVQAPLDTRDQGALDIDDATPLVKSDAPRTRASSSTTPQPPASGGRPGSTNTSSSPATCARPGPVPHLNCRGCRTTNRQLEVASQRDAADRRRAADAAALAADRTRRAAVAAAGTTPGAAAAVRAQIRKEEIS